MDLSTLLIVIWVTLLLSYSCTSVTTGVNWETANNHCRNQNDSLVDIKDVQNQYSYFKGLEPIWSSVKGHFTPWIAYRGCFHDENIRWLTTKHHLSKTICHILESNAPGNCYFECKSKNYTNGGCVNNEHFFFGLMGTICLCMCDNIIMQTLSESSKCNFMCRKSISNGECGGLNFFSVYESTTVELTDAHFGGFCLICQTLSHSNITMLYGKDCNANADGYCIMRNGSLSLKPRRATFDSYWSKCRNENNYIVGETSQICRHGVYSIWTGFRKYIINNSNTDNEGCYIIEIQNSTAIYNKRNCTEHHFFLCKQEIGQKTFSYMEYIKNTKSSATQPLTRGTSVTTRVPSSYRPFRPVPLSVTSLNMSTIDYTGSNISTTTFPQPSQSSKLGENTETLLGASIAGAVALILLSVVFLIICLLKRRKLQSKKSKKHKAKSDKVFDNTAYGDIVETNQKENVSYANTTAENDKPGSISKMDDIYVEKEEEYDHLHANRQKKMTIQMDDDRYGSATVLEDDSYSTLGQNKTVDSDFDNEYSVNSMPYSKNQSDAVNSPEYDFCYLANQ